jgi:calcium/calmodulin-dependent protein kinase (CaM kinase) II/calcium/calmodulin-dependent protein kinase I
MSELAMVLLYYVIGFAKYTDDSHNDGRGSLTSQCGTPTYVSPEIIQRHHYGTKTDMWSVGIILYILLGGYPPFVEDDQRALFRKICISDFEFHQEFFSRVSNGARALISSLLTVDPRRRLSAQEALDSDWILTEDDILENNDLTGINLERLRLFNAKRKVRAAVLSLLAVNKFLVNGDLMLKQLAIV